MPKGLLTAEVTEGRTRLLVPRESLGRAEPPTTPAFFNPAASVNRDITVAVTSATGGRSFCDSLAGVGARGVRVANEVRRKVAVTMLDINGISLALARKSASLNRVRSRCSILERDANGFLWSRGRLEERFDHVDVDPFGTPAPYLQGALNAVADGGLVAVTATDTAVLCGVYPRTARRRYWSAPLNNSFHHETGIRILVNFCRRLGGALDIGVFPVLAHSTRHYIRVYLRAEVGAARADEAANSEGFITVCMKCGEAAVDWRSTVCARCGAKVRSVGPLWTGKVTDQQLLARALKAAERFGFRQAGKTLAGLTGVDDFPPYSFSLEEVCSRLKVASVSPGRVSELLRARGYRTCAQPFEKTGLKSDAPRSEVERAVTEAAG